MHCTESCRSNTNQMQKVDQLKFRIGYYSQGRIFNLYFTNAELKQRLHLEKRHSLETKQNKPEKKIEKLPHMHL